MLLSYILYKFLICFFLKKIFLLENLRQRSIRSQGERQEAEAKSRSREALFNSPFAGGGPILMEISVIDGISWNIMGCLLLDFFIMGFLMEMFDRIYIYIYMGLKRFKHHCFVVLTSQDWGYM